LVDLIILAAEKNAFELIKVHRFELAAAFFLVAGNLKGALSVLFLQNG
jgi:hypothetical protein